MWLTTRLSRLAQPAPSNPNARPNNQTNYSTQNHPKPLALAQFLRKAQYPYCPASPSTPGLLSRRDHLPPTIGAPSSPSHIMPPITKTSTSPAPNTHHDPLQQPYTHHRPLSRATAATTTLPLLTSHQCLPSHPKLMPYASTRSPEKSMKKGGFFLTGRRRNEIHRGPSPFKKDKKKITITVALSGSLEHHLRT